MTGRLRIAIPLFPQFTALDAIGPYEVLQRIPTFDITFVGHARGEVRADNGANEGLANWCPRRAVGYTQGDGARRQIRGGSAMFDPLTVTATATSKATAKVAATPGTPPGP